MDAETGEQSVALMPDCWSRSGEPMIDIGLTPMSLTFTISMLLPAVLAETATTLDPTSDLFMAGHRTANRITITVMDMATHTT